MSEEVNKIRKNAFVLRLVLIVAVILSASALVVNMIFGPKLKREKLCGGLAEGQKFDLSSFAEKIRDIGRIPVVYVETASGSKQIEPPSPAATPLPEETVGAVSVNFGGVESPVRCVVRFKGSKISSVRKDDSD